MSTILIIYDVEPTFPATDQHPNAVRYQVGGKWVDAIGGEPTQEEIDAVLNPPPRSDRATAMLSRQREQVLEDLDVAIANVPASQRATFQLIRQLIGD